MPPSAPGRMPSGSEAGRFTIRLWFVPVVLLVLAMALGGCLVALLRSGAAGVEASTGPADPADYVIDLACRPGLRHTEATARLTNTADEPRRFRVLIEARDPSTGERVGRRSHYAALDPGEREAFTVQLVDVAGVTNPRNPDPVTCAFEVFMAG